MSPPLTESDTRQSHQTIIPPLRLSERREIQTYYVINISLRDKPNVPNEKIHTLLFPLPQFQGA
jgi:hypothetical protein